MVQRECWSWLGRSGSWSGAVATAAGSSGPSHGDDQEAESWGCNTQRLSPVTPPLDRPPALKVPQVLQAALPAGTKYLNTEGCGDMAHSSHSTCLLWFGFLCTYRLLSSFILTTSLFACKSNTIQVPPGNLDTCSMPRWEDRSGPALPC